MKNNTEEFKVTLQKALSLLPQDYALTEVRYHLRVAINKLESVEKKRERREVNSERRDLAKQQGDSFVSPYDPFKAILAIDEEIAKQKSKIEEIQRRRQQVKDEKGGDDELSTVFG